MSADNWAVCPRCKAKSDSDFDKLVARAAAAYGKAPEAEYLKLKSAIQTKPLYEHTLREDYELGIRGGGDFEVSYSCSCECGFSFYFNHKETVEIKPKGKQ